MELSELKQGDILYEAYVDGRFNVHFHEYRVYEVTKRGVWLSNEHGNYVWYDKCENCVWYSVAHLDKCCGKTKIEAIDKKLEMNKLCFLKYNKKVIKNFKKEREKINDT